MKKRITVVTFNSSAGLVYQRLHLPFRHLRHLYDFHFVDISDIRHIDLFYTDCLVMCHGYTRDFMYLAQSAKYHYRIPLIVDLDDLLMDLPIDHPDYSAINASTLMDTLQLATHAVYSTGYLKARLGHLNKKMTVIENTLDQRFDGYIQPVRPHKTVFTAGWTGGQTHRSDQLHTFYNGLKKFLIKHSDTRAHFHVLCPQELQRELGAQVYFDPKVVDYMDFHALAETFPFDVCMVGLIDHPFNHAKSDLRLLDMAPHRIPIIASPRYDFLKHKDKNICLYADDNDSNYMTWLEALEYAKAHPEEMKAMADRAWDYVEKNRLSTVAASKWNKIFKEVIPQETHQVDQFPCPDLQLQQLD